MTDAAAHEQVVALRPATLEDADFLLRIRNHPSVRAVSFNHDPVPLADHLKWLTDRLARPSPDLYVVVGPEGADAGVVRLDLTEAGDAEVSISIAPEGRGRGLGRAALKVLTAQARAADEIRRLVAYVLPGNEASMAVFERAGYGKVGWVEADPEGDGPPTAAWRFERPLSGSQTR